MSDYSEMGTIFTELMARGPKGPKCLLPILIPEASATGDSTKDKSQACKSELLCGEIAMRTLHPDEAQLDVVGQGSATLCSLERTVP